MSYTQRRSGLLILAWLTLCVSSEIFAAPPEKLGEKTYPKIDAKLYSQPNRYGKPLSIAAKGLELKVLKYSSSRAWALVETPSKRRGWIPVASTTIGRRYSASELARQQDKPESAKSVNSNKKGSELASRAPASDINLEEFGYSGEDYQQEAQDVEENLEDEAASAVSVDPGVTAAMSEAEGDVPPAPTEAFDVSALESDGSGQMVSGASQENLNEVAASSEQEAEYQPLSDEDLKQIQSSQTVAGKKANIKKLDSKSTSSRLFGVSAGLEYANQINVGQAHGFGFGLSGVYDLSPAFNLGLGVYWDRFGDRVQVSNNIINRTVGVLRLGPQVGFKHETFGLDALIGWTRSSTTFKETDTNGNLVESEANGSFAESAIGLRLSPYVDFALSELQAVRAYMAYSIDFYADPNVQGASGYPQSIVVGAAFSLSIF